MGTFFLEMTEICNEKQINFVKLKDNLYFSM